MAVHGWARYLLTARVAAAGEVRIAPAVREHQRWGGGPANLQKTVPR